MKLVVSLKLNPIFTQYTKGRFLVAVPKQSLSEL